MDAAAEVYVQGLSSYTVISLEDVLDLLRKSKASRVVRSTDMNSQSSRSHFILQLEIELEIRESNNRIIIRRAKLNLGKKNYFCIYRGSLSVMS